MATVYKFSQFQEIPLESRWFRAFKIAEGVTALYEPYHFQEVISYLIEGSEKALLLDSGMGIGNIKAAAEFLTEKEITLVLSHNHFDHAGGAYQFGECFLYDYKPSVNSLQNGYKLAEGDENKNKQAFSLKGSLWVEPKSSCNVKPCRVKPIREGFCFELGDRSLVVLHTPGHSEDSIMLCDEKNRLLFTGDTVYPGPLYAFLMDESSPERYRQTIEALSRKYYDYTLICSHNNPVMKGSALLEIAAGFDKILSGSAKGEDYYGYSNFLFEGFSIVV